MELVEQEEPRICVTTHRKRSVMLCGCEREGAGVSGAEEDEIEACSSLQMTLGSMGLHLEARIGDFY